MGRVVGASRFSCLILTSQNWRLINAGPSFVLTILCFASTFCRFEMSIQLNVALETAVQVLLCIISFRVVILVLGNFWTRFECIFNDFELERSSKFQITFIGHKN